MSIIRALELLFWFIVAVVLVGCGGLVISLVFAFTNAMDSIPA